jgi:hypothetical protein
VCSGFQIHHPLPICVLVFPTRSFPLDLTTLSRLQCPLRPQIFPSTLRIFNTSTRTSSFKTHHGTRAQAVTLDFATNIRRTTINLILKDLERSKASITFDEFLKHILHVSSEWCHQEKPRIEKIVNSKRYQDMLRRYTAPRNTTLSSFHRTSQPCDGEVARQRGVCRILLPE